MKLFSERVIHLGRSKAEIFQEFSQKMYKLLLQQAQKKNC